PTWIRSRRIVAFWVVAAGIVVLGAVVASFWLPGLAIALLAIPFLYIAIVLTWTAHCLGPRGGDVQSRIHQLLIDSVGNEGRLLDLGCGNGQLLIRFAKSAPGEYLGLDTGVMTGSMRGHKPSATRSLKGFRVSASYMEAHPSPRSPPLTSKGWSVL